MYILWRSSSSRRPRWLLWEDISAICNSHLGDLQWIQASLSIQEGEFGNRNASSLALSAFLSSTASTFELKTVIHSNSSSGVDYAIQGSRACWSTFINTSCPVSMREIGIWHTPIKIGIWRTPVKIGIWRHFPRWRPLCEVARDMASFFVSITWSVSLTLCYKYFTL